MHTAAARDRTTPLCRAGRPCARAVERTVGRERAEGHARSVRSTSHSSIRCPLQFASAPRWWRDVPVATPSRRMPHGAHRDGEGPASRPFNSPRTMSRFSVRGRRRSTPPRGGRSACTPSSAAAPFAAPRRLHGRRGPRRRRGPPPSSSYSIVALRSCRDRSARAAEVAALEQVGKHLRARRLDRRHERFEQEAREQRALRALARVAPLEEVAHRRQALAPLAARDLPVAVGIDVVEEELGLVLVAALRDVVRDQLVRVDQAARECRGG